MTEESMPGATGRLLGTNNLQRAIDGIERSVQRLSTAIERTLPTLERGVASATSAVSGVRSGTSWKPMTGNAPNGGGATGLPNAQAFPNPGSRRADGPAQVAGFLSSGGGEHRGSGNGAAATGFAVGAAYQFGRSVNANVGHTSRQSADDSRLMLGFAQYYGMGISGTPAYKSMFSGWVGAQNTQDMVAAAQTVTRNGGGVPGSTQFRTNMALGGAAAITNPFMSNAQSAAFQASFRSPRSFNMMRLVGVNTSSGIGGRRSTTQIAEDILKQVGLGSKKLTAAQINFVIDDPLSNLNQTLDNWVSNGVISEGQRDGLKEQMRSVLKVRNAGMSANQLSVLSAAAASGDKGAMRALNKVGVGNSQIQTDKNLEAQKRDASVQRLSGFEDGLRQSTKELEKFHDVLNAITGAIPGLNYASGLSRGLGENGRLGAGLGILGFSMPALKGAGGVISGAAGALGGMLGIGGNNDARMYAGAAAHGAGSSLRHSAGGYSGVGGGGGGTGKSTNSGSSSVKLTWPCKGPLTAGFNQSGSHWSSGHHTGQDIAVPTGTPIHAAAAGTVDLVSSSGPYGNHVRINHGGGVQTLYAHNSRVKVKVGQSVGQGQVIAYSGATGNVTGPHCHFEVILNGTPVDPLKYLKGAPLNVGSGAPQGTTTSAIGSAGGGNASGSSLGGSSSSTSTTTTTFAPSAMSGGVAAMGMFSEAATIDGALSGGMSAGIGSSSVTTTSTTDSPSTYGSSSGSGGRGKNTYGAYTPPSNGSSTPTTGGHKTKQPGDNAYNAVTGEWYNTNAAAAPSTATGNRGIGQKMAAARGWTGAQWDSLLTLWDHESGWRTDADNPTSSAYGIPQALITGRSMPKGYYTSKTGSGANTHAYGGDPAVQIKWGLDYIAGRYGNPVNAWRFWKAHHWYDKGAWDIQQDEDARVHKGEMVIPASQARQIREVLLNNNPYGATANGSKASQGVVLQFNSGSIVLKIGAGASATTGKAIAKDFVDALATDERIKALQTGRRVLNG